ncbi:hypothetical protein [Chamaesiphon polymorphus]|nr:hypothetical protein [Chamaesiphon polymorphus]
MTQTARKFAGGFVGTVQYSRSGSTQQPISPVDVDRLPTEVKVAF